MSIRSQLTQEELDAPQSPITFTRDELASACAAMQVTLEFGGWGTDEEDQARRRATESAYAKLIKAKRY